MRVEIEVTGETNTETIARVKPPMIPRDRVIVDHTVATMRVALEDTGKSSRRIWTTIKMETIVTAIRPILFPTSKRIR